MLSKMGCLIAALALLLSSETRAQAEKPLKLDDLIVEALQNNPGLRSAKNMAAAARTKIGRATSWESPQLGVEFYQVPVQSFPNPLKNNMETDYYLQQMIPFPGKLSAMGSAADYNAAMENQNAMALERSVIRQLKSAYYELYFVQRKIRINGENQILLRSFVDVARKRYEVGTGGQSDILRAQTELSKLINDGINLGKEESAAESMINMILSRPTDQALGQVPEIEGEIPQWSFSDVRPLALESRPELKAMRSGIEMSNSEVKLARREYYPDLMARVMYKDMAMTPNDFWSVMVGVSIPLSPWSSSRYTSKVEENELNVRRAQDDYANMENMVLFQVRDALVKVSANRNLVLLYRNTVIPQAEQTLQSTVASYQTGKTEFLMVIDAYRTLLDAKLEYYMAVMDEMASQAQLEQAAGLSIADLESRIR